MKHWCLYFMLVSIWLSCQNTPTPRTAAELQNLKTALEAKKKELADKQEIAKIEQELKAVEQQISAIEKTAQLPAEIQGQEKIETALPEKSSEDKPNAQIVGSNVTMRKEASVQSEKLGSFDAQESVEVLETKNVNNDREAILSKPITVKGSGGEVNLPKGKAVVIESYQSERNYYLVTYQDPQKGKLTAEVDASAVETITYSTWYKVKRKNGETGWVLGKFLKIN